ncbi:VTT domain-containing protein, partial [Escherichia coli]|nr:VTT domain-containing protein [Escherichia coli]
KHGGRAIIFARFVPIIRTFAPIVAGIVSMEKKKFMFYNIVSSFLWAFTLIFAGHYLYDLFLTKFEIDLKAHIEFIVLGIVAITTV